MDVNSDCNNFLNEINLHDALTAWEDDWIILKRFKEFYRVFSQSSHNLGNLKMYRTNQY